MSLDIRTWDATVRVKDLYGNVHDVETFEFDDMCKDSVINAAEEKAGDMLDALNIMDSGCEILLQGYVYAPETDRYVEVERIRIV